MGKAYWDIITRDEQELVLPDIMQALKTWHERARKVMYWLSNSIFDAMIVHIQDARTPKDAWDTIQTILLGSLLNSFVHDMKNKFERGGGYIYIYICISSNGYILCRGKI